MAVPSAVTVSGLLPVRNLNFLSQIWQGGAMALVDMETSPGVKQGYLNILGHIMPAGGGAAHSSKVKSSPFVQAMATGVGVAVGEPISQLDPTIQVKINANSMLAVSSLLMGNNPTQVTQAAVSTDTPVAIASVVLDVEYALPVANTSKFVAYLTASPNTPYSATGATPDY